MHHTQTTRGAAIANNGDAETTPATKQSTMRSEDTIMAPDQIPHEPFPLVFRRSVYYHPDSDGQRILFRTRQQVQTTEKPGQPTVARKTRCDSNPEVVDGAAPVHVADGKGSGMSEIEYAQRELEDALQSALCRPWSPLPVKLASEKRAEAAPADEISMEPRLSFLDPLRVEPFT